MVLPVAPTLTCAVYARRVDTYTPAEITERLGALRAEHRALDDRITHMAANGSDDLESKRLKRHRLQLKDCISRLESLQIPDEPA
nr:YdcH family protein [Stenotrophomonas sp. CFBP 13725]